MAKRFCHTLMHWRRSIGMKCDVLSNQRQNHLTVTALKDSSRTLADCVCSTSSYSATQSMAILIVIWVAAFAMAIPPLLQFGHYVQDKSKIRYDITESHCWRSENYVNFFPDFINEAFPPGFNHNPELHSFTFFTSTRTQTCSMSNLDWLCREATAQPVPKYFSLYTEAICWGDQALPVSLWHHQAIKIAKWKPCQLPGSGSPSSSHKKFASFHPKCYLQSCLSSAPASDISRMSLIMESKGQFMCMPSIFVNFGQKGPSNVRNAYFLCFMQFFNLQSSLLWPLGLSWSWYDLQWMVSKLSEEVIVERPKSLLLSELLALHSFTKLLKSFCSSEKVLVLHRIKRIGTEGPSFVALLFSFSFLPFSCGPNWTERKDMPFVAYMFTFGFFLPVTIIIPSNASVVSTLRKVELHLTFIIDIFQRGGDERRWRVVD